MRKSIYNLDYEKQIENRKNKNENFYFFYFLLKVNGNNFNFNQITIENKKIQKYLHERYWKNFKKLIPNEKK